jgi:hypothetical protein
MLPHKAKHPVARVASTASVQPPGKLKPRGSLGSSMTRSIIVSTIVIVSVHITGCQGGVSAPSRLSVDPGVGIHPFDAGRGH